MDFLQESADEAKLVRVVEQCLAQRNLDALWALGAPESVVPALAPSLFYHLVRVAEHDDREILVLHASTEQVQCCWDMDAWKHDRFDLSGADEWMAQLLELPDEKFLEKIHGLLPDGFGLYLLSSVTIYNIKLNPDIPENPVFYTTPDEYFELQPAQGASDESWRLAVQFVDRWYALDAYGIQKLLLHATHELPTFLEEDAFALRNGRIRDEGFWDVFEAREIYRPVDPARIRLDAHDLPLERPYAPAVLPVPVREPVRDRLGQGVEALEGPQADAVRANFALLCNRIMAADEVDVGDENAMVGVMQKARAAVNLALDYFRVHRGVSPQGVLQRVHVSRLFQCGYFLMEQLAQLARELMKSGVVSLSPGTYTLLEGPWLAFFQALVGRVPMLNQELAGKAGNVFPSDLEQVGRATEWIEEMSMFRGICFEVLRIPAEVLTDDGAARTCRNNPGSITFGDLFRTAAAALVLQGRSDVMALSAASARRFLSDAGMKAAAREALARRIADVTQLPGGRIDRIVSTHLEPWESARDPETVLLVAVERPKAKKRSS